jgi:hypothetical protein
MLTDYAVSISFVSGMDDYVLGVAKHGKAKDSGLSQAIPQHLFMEGPRYNTI